MWLDWHCFFSSYGDFFFDSTSVGIACELSTSTTNKVENCSANQDTGYRATDSDSRCSTTGDCHGFFLDLETSFWRGME